MAVAEEIKKIDPTTMVIGYWHSNKEYPIYRGGQELAGIPEWWCRNEDGTVPGALLTRITTNVAAALVKMQGPSEMDRTFYSRSTLSLLIVWQDQFLFQAAHTGPSPNVKQDLM